MKRANGELGLAVVGYKQPNRLRHYANRAGALALGALSLSLVSPQLAARGAELRATSDMPAAPLIQTGGHEMPNSRALQSNEVGQEPAPMMVIVTSNDALADEGNAQEDLQEDEIADQQIEQSGANALRVLMPYNQGQAGIGDYTDMICASAQAAQDHDLKFIVSYRGYYVSTQPGISPPGFVPQNSTDDRKFDSYVDSILWTLDSGVDLAKGQPGGCIKDEQQIYIEDLDETNSDEPFNGALNAQTPEETMIREAKLYNAIHREEIKAEISTDVEVIGGNLAGANNNPIGTLEAMGEADSQLHLGKAFDILDIHPYPVSTTQDPAITVQQQYPQIIRKVNQFFPNMGVKIIFGEVGVPEYTPPVKQTEYDTNLSASLAVSPAEQAQDIAETFEAAGCDPDVIGAGYFHIDDAPGDGNIPYGIFYPDGTPKPDYGLVRNIFEAAADGNLPVCQ